MVAIVICQIGVPLLAGSGPLEVLVRRLTLWSPIPKVRNRYLWFLKGLFSLYVCECSACLYVNILCIYLVPKEARELPGIRDMKNCETSCRCWELNLETL